MPAARTHLSETRTTAKEHRDHKRLDRLLIVSLCAATVVAASSRSFLALDGQLMNWVRAHQVPGQVHVALIVTWLGSTPCGLGVMVLGSLMFLAKRRWPDAMLLTLAVGGVGRFIGPLKQFFDRPRPIFLDQTLTFIGSGFPSGHAMTIAALCGSMWVVSMRRERRPARRHAAFGIAAAVVAVVAATRVYLGAHYLTDVVGGVAFGLLWLVISDAAVDWLEPYFQPDFVNGR
jgi:undecaprenyl-diphosphatase